MNYITFLTPEERIQEYFKRVKLPNYLVMRMKLFNEELMIPKLEEGCVIYPGIKTEACTMSYNKVFRDELTFTEFTTGRSSVKAHFVSLDTGNKYEMFLKDFEELLRGKAYNYNAVCGEFCFRKAGNNYGVVLLED